eukprot:gene6423-8841_t
MMDSVPTSVDVDTNVGDETLTVVKTKKEKSNAKPVECYDLQGNLIEVFRSGLLASQKLGIQQGDISLICRGLKFSMNGYRFRFEGDLDRYLLNHDPATKIKKGFQLEVINDTKGANEFSRTTRASRGDLQTRHQQTEKETILPPFSVKVRKWQEGSVQCGHFIISKWVPENPLQTPELKEFLAKSKEKDGKKSKRVSKVVHKSAVGNFRSSNNTKESRVDGGIDGTDH